jgi:glycerol-3-phosphate O-acyltransferase/dihydroxyacetone phosphate acyltransferase
MSLDSTGNPRKGVSFKEESLPETADVSNEQPSVGKKLSPKSPTRPVPKNDQSNDSLSTPILPRDSSEQKPDESSLSASTTSPPAPKAAAKESAGGKSAPSSGKPDRESPTPKLKVSSAEMESSILKKEKKPEKIRCSDCGEYFTPEEWPNHKDRLRKVPIREVTLTALQKYIALPLVDFLMWFLTTIFFREVAVVGKENIPESGPVVFYANHQNQFIDAMVLRATTGRNCRFIIAEKSMHRPIIGHFARMMNAVPVIRPQDVPLSIGTGNLVNMDPCAKTGAANVVSGVGTKFTQLAQGDVITWATPSGGKCSAQIFQVIDDTTVAVTTPIAENDRVKVPTPFKYSKRIDQSEMYAQVYNTLGKGDAIAIFPEGGSHDRTSLQPLKAGVALFTLGAAERGIFAKMVPVGLTYMHGDRFRSKVHVEIGKPISPPAHLIELFDKDKRKATGEMLEALDANLRAVTINVSDWPTLKFLHSFRRLYQPSDVILETRDYLRLTRRLSIIMKEHEEDPDFQDFRVKVENYMDYCNALLIKDAQAATLASLKTESIRLDLLSRRILMLAVFGVVLIPYAVLALPIGLIARTLSEDHSRTALKSSSVKVVGADVKASYKIISCFFLIPLEFFIVSSIVWWHTDLRTAATVFASIPMMMYVSLLITQEFMLELRATLPLLMSIMSKHKQFLKLHDRRERLVASARQIVEKFDPALKEEMNSLERKDDNKELRQPSLFSLRGNRTARADPLSLKKRL